MENQKNLSSELNAFYAMTDDMQDIYSDGWTQTHVDLLRELYNNNSCTADQIKKWGMLIVSQWNPETYKSKPPPHKFLMAMFFKATHIKKEQNHGDVNSHDYMLHYCKDMTVQEIYKLGKTFHDMHMGKFTDPKLADNFDLKFCGFSTHWQPLLTEVNNIVDVHGKDIFKNDYEFKKRLNDIKKAILKKEHFEQFWHKNLNKISHSDILVEKFISGYCGLKNLDKKTSMVDCKLCDRDPKHLDCEYFKTQKSV